MSAEVRKHHRELARYGESQSRLHPGYGETSSGKTGPKPLLLMLCRDPDAKLAYRENYYNGNGRLLLGPVRESYVAKSFATSRHKRP